MFKTSSLSMLAVAATVLFAASAQADTVNCPTTTNEPGGPYTRYVSVTNALAGGGCWYGEGNLITSGQQYNVPSGLSLIEKDVVGQPGANTGTLQYTTSNGTNGTWTAAASAWTGSNLYLGFHFGGGQGTPDWFVVQLQPTFTTGNWSLNNFPGITVPLNGLSNIYLFGSPGTHVPEPASLALVGLGLLGLAAAGRRKAQA